MHMLIIQLFIHFAIYPNNNWIYLVKPESAFNDLLGDMKERGKEGEGAAGEAGMAGEGGGGLFDNYPVSVDSGEKWLLSLDTGCQTFLQNNTCDKRPMCHDHTNISVALLQSYLIRLREFSGLVHIQPVLRIREKTRSGSGNM